MLNITFTPDQKLTSQSERHTASDKKTSEEQEFAAIFEIEEGALKSVPTSQTSPETIEQKSPNGDSAHTAEETEVDTGSAKIADEKSNAISGGTDKLPTDTAAMNSPRGDENTKSEPATFSLKHAQTAEDVVKDGFHSRQESVDPLTKPNAATLPENGDFAAAATRSDADKVELKPTNPRGEAIANHILPSRSQTQELLVSGSNATNRAEPLAPLSSATAMPKKTDEVTRLAVGETSASQPLAANTPAKSFSSGQTESAMRGLMQPMIETPTQNAKNVNELPLRSDSFTQPRDVDAPPDLRAPANDKSTSAQNIMAPTIDGVQRDKMETAKISSVGLSGALDADFQLFPNLDVKSSAPLRIEQIIHQPELPKHIARQLAEVVRAGPDRPIELTLNPEELGRVRLTLSSLENGMTVTVLAERGETMDLMRRHIDQLTREFHALGYQNIEFSFGQQSEKGASESGTPSGSENTNNPAVEEHDSAAGKLVQLTLGGTQGVDIRI